MSRIIGEFIDSIIVRFDGFSERERRMSTIFLVAVSALIIVGSLYFFTSSIANKQAQIALSTKRSVEIKALKSQYELAKKKALAQEKKFKNNKVSLFSLIQNEANSYSLPLYDLSERSDPIKNSSLIQTSVVINLKSVSVDRLTAFISALEEAEGEMVKVVKLKIKSRYDSSQTLDAQMTVATWKTV
ncbi:MAG: type II secretion system protein GspM [bacterium]|nr:type II secretion system protein GspM [bacterium]